MQFDCYFFNRRGKIISIGEQLHRGYAVQNFSELGFKEEDVFREDFDELIRRHWATARCYGQHWSVAIPHLRGFDKSLKIWAEHVFFNSEFRGDREVRVVYYDDGLNITTTIQKLMLGESQ